ncbi:MAG: hydroxymyristoyl-ACP dehydratase [Chthoniobacter sp.]|jgi:3-hydroxyacyl-[acyl-carrier-protein] dehydratase|nr:hydroxymyristoyl-ACP dehydratase [Chthoniobacter sp.]
MGQDPIALGLPHRAPFIFVDEVVERTPDEHAVCRKTFAPDEPFFRGHFPGDPLVPGVILTEALAQTAGLAAGREDRGFRLSAIKGMKFLAPVRPAQLIELTARKLGAIGGLWQWEVSARVAGSVVAEGVLVLSEV